MTNISRVERIQTPMLIEYGDKKLTSAQVSHLFNDLNHQIPPISRPLENLPMNDINS